jgi:hypothetical protein
VAAPFAAPRPPVAVSAGSSPVLMAISGEVEEIGTRSVEVTTMLGDQVIEVRHFSNPMAGSVTSGTKLLLASGAAALLTALVVFFSVLLQESGAKASFERWIGTGQDASKFVWPHVSPALDALLVFAALYAAVAILMGLRKVADERSPRDYTIGPGMNAIYKVSPQVVPVPEFPLVHSIGSDYEVLWSSSMSGEAQVDGRSYRLEEIPGARPSHEVSGATAWSLRSPSRTRCRCWAMSDGMSKRTRAARRSGMRCSSCSSSRSHQMPSRSRSICSIVTTGS